MIDELASNDGYFQTHEFVGSTIDRLYTTACAFIVQVDPLTKK